MTNAGAGGTASDLWKRSFDLTLQAVSAAKAVKKRPDNAVIEWTAFPPEILADVQTLAQSGRDAMDKPVAVPFLEPQVTVDGPSVFTNPVELAPLSPAAFAVNGSSSSIDFTFDPMKVRLGARFTPDPFAAGNSFDWKFAKRAVDASNAHPNWAALTFDPGKRFTSGFSCN